MEFGKLDDISEVQWTLPQNDPQNASRFSPNLDPKLLLGSPAWGARHWLGKIYPLKSKPEEFLYYYSRNFNCIELNTTHYRIPDYETAKGWLSQVPKEFKFCPKLHKDISHSRFGPLDKTILNHWLSFLEQMQTHLGPCFIQFHEMFSYAEKSLLFQFLENWPSDYRLCVELRHSSWFHNGVILPALADYLHKKNIGLVITDVAGRRDVLHSTLSAPWCQIRLIGNDLDPSDSQRLQDWAMRIKQWQNQGLQETFLFLHQTDDILTIEFARLAHTILSQHGFKNIPTFLLQEEQGTLL